MPKKPETPEEKWDAITRFAREAEAREMADQSDEQVAAELKSRGYDLASVDREGDAFVDQLLATMDADVAKAAPDSGRLVAEAREAVIEDERPGRKGRVVPLRSTPRRASWAVTLLAAAILVMLGLAAAMTIAVRDNRVPEPEPPYPTHAPAPSHDEMVAVKLRQDGHEACARHEWQSCMVKLDDAKTVDPAGDSAPGVAADRARAAAGMKEEEPRKAVGDASH